MNCGGMDLRARATASRRSVGQERLLAERRDAGRAAQNRIHGQRRKRLPRTDLAPERRVCGLEELVRQRGVVAAPRAVDHRAGEERAAQHDFAARE